MHTVPADRILPLAYALAWSWMTLQNVSSTDCVIGSVKVSAIFSLVSTYLIAILHS